VTAHAAETYFPRRERKGTALCLSGGGFRAALFHLGALRRLNELGVLAQVDTISAVSGGSILAAFLAQRVSTWPAETAEGLVLPPAEWERLIARPFRDFTRCNLRTGPLLRRLLPSQWLGGSAAIEALERAYRRRVTRLTLRDLPERPRFIVSATDMAFGANWTFEKGAIGDYRAGTVAPPPSDYPVARAVAASSCFPPVFDPLPIRLEPDQLKGGAAARHPNRDALIRGLQLTDGGVYDNMGLEPVWKDHRTLLVSDGGATFDFAWDKGLLWRLMRYAGLADNQARSLRKRWLIAGFVRKVLAGAYWGIGSAAASYDLPGGYSKALAAEVIAEMRTDMDAFTEAEIAVLENHGYWLADAAIRKHATGLLSDDPPPPSLPHREPEWTDEESVRRALAQSGKVTLWGRH
jgi:NTE family protein